MASRLLRWLLNSIWNYPLHTLRDIIRHRSSEAIFVVAESNSTSKLASLKTLFLLFHYFYLICLAARFMLAGLFGSHRSDLYTRHDYFLAILFRIKFINTLSSLCISLLPLCALYVDYVVRLKRFNYVWYTVGEVLLVNPESFFQLNPDLKPPLHAFNLMLSPVDSVILLKEWARRMWNLPPGFRHVPRFHTAKLSYYPNLSIRLRLRLILVHYGTGLFCAWILLLTLSILLPLGGFFIYYAMFRLQASWLIKLSFALECTLLVYFVAYCQLRGAIFFFQSFAPTVVVLVEYLGELNRLLEIGLNRMKKWNNGYGHENRRQLAAAQQFHAIVRFYRREYATLLLDGLISDQQLVSSIALAAAASNAPLSQFLLVERIFVPQNTPIDSLVLFGQALFCALMGWCVIYIADRYYYAAKHLLPVPLHLKGESLKYRLQLSHLIEQIYCRSRKRRFAYSCGPFGHLTRRFFLEATICYIGYALYTYGLFRKSSSITQYAAAHLGTPQLT